MTGDATRRAGGQGSDERIGDLRWCNFNNRKRAHLWLGSPGTACGLGAAGTKNWTVTAYNIPELNCEACEAYARGWLDRHDTGASPAITDPNPLGMRPIPSRRGAA